MERLIQFTKIEAAGNDFIFLDAAEININAQIVKQLCARHFGIGADGLIVMDGLHMRYFNADGSRGNMCGNGLRAAVLFSYIKGLIPRGEFVQFEAEDGTHLAQINSPDDISVEIIEYPDAFFVPDLTGKLPIDISVLGFFNTGVPHLVLKVSADLEKTDVRELGKKLRFDLTFAPDGTNVNFISISNSNSIQIRTYERGVEEETLACGTGAVAAFLAAFPAKDKLATVQSRGGRLKVFQKEKHLFLNGTARITFVGSTVVKNESNSI